MGTSIETPDKHYNAEDYIYKGGPSRLLFELSLDILFTTNQ